MNDTPSPQAILDCNIELPPHRLFIELRCVCQNSAPAALTAGLIAAGWERMGSYTEMQTSRHGVIYRKTGPGRLAGYTADDWRAELEAIWPLLVQHGLARNLDSSPTPTTPADVAGPVSKN